MRGQTRVAFLARMTLEAQALLKGPFGRNDSYAHFCRSAASEFFDVVQDGLLVISPLHAERDVIEARAAELAANLEEVGYLKSSGPHQAGIRPRTTAPRSTYAVRQSVALAKARFTAGSVSRSFAGSMKLGIQIANTLLDSADLNLDVDHAQATRTRARRIHDRYLTKLDSIRIDAEDRAEIHERLGRLDVRLELAAKRGEGV
jgi:hypothetical protein